MYNIHETQRLPAFGLRLIWVWSLFEPKKVTGKPDQESNKTRNIFE